MEKIYETETVESLSFQTPYARGVLIDCDSEELEKFLKRGLAKEGDIETEKRCGSFRPPAIPFSQADLNLFSSRGHPAGRQQENSFVF
ncbi:MAG: hypothetical protein Q8P95_03410 [bacterium]|nr:hypothetical protein [bacterium]